VTLTSMLIFGDTIVLPFVCRYFPVTALLEMPLNAPIYAPLYFYILISIKPNYHCTISHDCILFYPFVSVYLPTLRLLVIGGFMLSPSHTSRRKGRSILLLIQSAIYAICLSWKENDPLGTC